MIKDIIQSVVEEMRVFDASVVNDGSGLYSVTIAALDVQYWHVGARMGFLDSGTYYYGYVTAIASPVLSVTMDGLEAGLVAITEFIMDINYIHDTPVGLFDQIARMADNGDYKLRRFPVIALIHDFSTDTGVAIDSTPIQIVIAVRTEPKYTGAQRYTYSYEGKRLIKIKERFVRYLTLNRSTYFRKQDITNDSDRLYWGKEGALGGTDNKAYDFIDAIELDIELKTFETC